MEVRTLTEYIINFSCLLESGDFNAYINEYIGL